MASDAGQPRRQTVHYITMTTAQRSRCPGRLSSRNVSFTIEENTAPGSIVGYLSSSEHFDAINSNDDVSDTNAGRETFWLVAGNAMDTFSVDSVTGALVIGGPVDFEVCSSYGLVVRILDDVGKCVGKLHVEVIVVNVNDNPPHFDLDLTYITVLDTTPLGAAVYAPAAYDADGSTLFFAIGEKHSSVGVASWLEVDDVTGHVIARRPLEGAPRRMYVVITATDVSDDDVINVVTGHMTSMTLVVTVVKDATASCVQARAGRTQRVTVVEDAEIGSIIAAAENEHIITSSCELTLTHSIVSSNDYDAFSIDRFTGELTLIVFA